jgi:L-asparaginase / beta-aspartyl-peptidase
MDAAMMEGKDLTAGGVAGLEGYLHPISAARLVMTHTDHVLIIGHHAKRLARHFGLRRLPKTRKTGKRPSGSLHREGTSTPCLFTKKWDGTTPWGP